MKTNKIYKMVSAMLSVLMLQGGLVMKKIFLSLLFTVFSSFLLCVCTSCGTLEEDDLDDVLLNAPTDLMEYTSSSRETDNDKNSETVLSNQTSTTVQDPNNFNTQTKDSIKNEINLVNDTNKAEATETTSFIEINTNEQSKTEATSFSEADTNEQSVIETTSFSEVSTDEKPTTEETIMDRPDSNTAHTSQQNHTQEILDKTSYLSSIDDIKNIYIAEEIIDFIDYCSGPNMVTFLHSLNERFPIEYLVIPSRSAPYCVYKVEGDDKLYVFFNEDEESLRDVTYFFLVKEKLTQESFFEISRGSTLADVEAIDAGTRIINTINANSLSQGFTLHIVEGGFIKITYENRMFNGSNSTIDDSNEYIVKEIVFIPYGEAIDIPRIFNDGPIHYSVSEYNK